MRWKQSMNENAKAPAFWNAYPELDHNEVCGWGQHGDVTRQLFTLVELAHGLEHPQLPRRAAATREIIEEALHQVLHVEAEGEGRLAQLLDLMYLGDWTSYYVALANDVDPGPIDAITQLKAAPRAGVAHAKSMLLACLVDSRDLVERAFELRHSMTVQNASSSRSPSSSAVACSRPTPGWPARGITVPVTVV